jgi:hypothetical protein
VKEHFPSLTITSCGIRSQAVGSRQHQRSADGTSDSQAGLQKANAAEAYNRLAAARPAHPSRRPALHTRTRNHHAHAHPHLQVKSLLTKHKLRGSGAARAEAERRDVISHFILRLAYCRSAGAGLARAGARVLVAWAGRPRAASVEVARVRPACGPQRLRRSAAAPARHCRAEGMG